MRKAQSAEIAELLTSVPPLSWRSATLDIEFISHPDRTEGLDLYLASIQVAFTCGRIDRALHRMQQCQAGPKS
jgi:hypothetical protein